MHEVAKLKREKTVLGWGLNWTPDGRYLIFLAAVLRSPETEKYVLGNSIEIYVDIKKWVTMLS